MCACICGCVNAGVINLCFFNEDLIFLIVATCSWCVRRLHKRGLLGPGVSGVLTLDKKLDLLRLNSMRKYVANTKHCICTLM